MFTEDLAPFFQAADFSQACTYKAGGTGAGVTINVILDVPTMDLRGIGVTATNPTLLARASDIPSFSNADTFMIGSTTYRGINSEPQDDGAVVRIQLEKQ